MARLVALAMAPGPGFVDVLRRTWDAGDAVFPLDVRLPPAHQRALLDRIRPAVIVDAEGEERALDGGVPVLDGDAVVMATSGTTGTPKGVVLTHAAVASSAHASSAALGVDSTHDHWLACLPLAHVGGLSVVIRALLTATGLTVLERFDPEAAAAAARSGANLVSLVPPLVPRVEAGAWRRILVGGMAPGVALPPNAVTTYGMTETASGIVYDGVPLDGVELGIGEEGVIRVQGSMLLRAYRTAPTPAGAAVRSTPEGVDPKDAGGWFTTADSGALDGDGRLTVHGRLDDAIVTGGEKVWPAAVEAVLRALPGIADAAVAGVPDPEWGERVSAVVVPTPGAVVTLGPLKDAVAAALAPWAAPRELVVVGALPRGESGKLLRQSVRALATTRRSMR